MMKTQKSIKNSIWAMISNIFSVVIGLVAQSIFLRILDVEYLGLNGLFSNIISMLAIVELGIGSAIIYNLYKPLSENNTDLVKSLMNFYKKSYHIIGLIVFGIGIVIMPFLTFFIKEVNVAVNIYIVYFLFLIDTLFSYFLSYKRSLLQADQKNYIINRTHIIYLILMNSAQLIMLYFTKNYYLYLGVKILFRILENLVITIIVNHKYPYIKDNNICDLEKDIKNDIFTKIKALFFHKIGSFVVVGTDNIVISKFLGVVAVGLYSNYYLIINAVQTLFSQMLYGVSASVGHLLVENNVKKSYEVFNKLRFINFWIATISGVCICVIIQAFVSIWLGGNYLLSYSVVIVLSINLFLKLMTCSFSIYKESAGIFKEDRFIPIIESIINIVVSVILVKIIGIAGVFIGTIVSSLTYFLYSYPRFIYKGIFKRNYIQYIKENGKYLIIFFIILAISIFVSIVFEHTNLYINFIIKCLIGFIIPNLMIVLLYRKKDEFKFVISVIKSIFKKGAKNENKI